MEDEKISIKVHQHVVSGLLRHPKDAKALLVLGHGAGAGMTHPFMEQLAADLAEFQIASLRYNFPYMEAGRRSPNAPALSQDTVRAAVGVAKEVVPDLPLIAGGKSYGGRMTSAAQAAQPLPQVKGLVFFGFPLHAPGRPGPKRGEHLKQISIPMLFLQGTRDKLADLSLMEPLCSSLGSKTTLQVIDGADHGFSTLKSASKTTPEIRKDLARVTGTWFKRISGSL